MRVHARGADGVGPITTVPTRGAAEAWAPFGGSFRADLAVVRDPGGNHHVVGQGDDGTLYINQRTGFRADAWVGWTALGRP